MLKNKFTLLFSNLNVFISQWKNLNLRIYLFLKCQEYDIYMFRHAFAINLQYKNWFKKKKKEGNSVWQKILPSRYKYNF